MDKIVQALKKQGATRWAQGQSGFEQGLDRNGVVRGVGNCRPEKISLTETCTVVVEKSKLQKRHIYVNATDRQTAVAISAYRNLRTQVLKSMADVSASSLLITGPTKSVGKTLTAINLAISIARHERRTALLVDLDLRHPSIHTYFGIDPNLSMVDVLRGNATLGKSLITPGIERLTLLLGRNPHEDSAELLLSASMQSLIHEMVSRYKERIVIFDAPPVLGCDDVAAIAPTIDACLLVTEESKTSRRELREALEKIEDIPVVGVVLNKSKGTNVDRYYY